MTPPLARVRAAVFTRLMIVFGCRHRRPTSNRARPQGVTTAALLPYCVAAAPPTAAFTEGSPSRDITMVPSPVAPTCCIEHCCWSPTSPSTKPLHVVAASNQFGAVLLRAATFGHSSHLRGLLCPSLLSCSLRYLLLPVDPSSENMRADAGDDQNHACLKDA